MRLESIIALAYFNLYSLTKTCLELILSGITRVAILVFDELNCHQFPGKTLEVVKVFDFSNHTFKRSSLNPTISLLKKNLFMYKCLKNNYLFLGDYSIRCIHKNDIMPIRDWRNLQIDVLRQNESLTKEQQVNYFTSEIFPSFIKTDPKQILLSFFYKNELIGYGGLVHISWQDKRGELSFLTNPSRHQNKIYEDDFTSFILLIKQLAFDDLGFNRIHGETFAFRDFHISIMERNGFVREGIMKRHVQINNKFFDSIIHGCNKSVNTSCDELANESKFNNLLLTSISSKTSMIKALKNAANRISQNIKVYGVDIKAECVGKYFVDFYYELPKFGDMPAKDLVEFCKKHFISSIIPSRDGELLYFAKIKNHLFENGISVMVSDETTIKICLDKFNFFVELSGKGFNSIPTYFRPIENDIDRWVVKERFGAASTGLAINVSKAEALSFSSRLQSPIFQPFIIGKEYSVDVYISRSGKIKGIICRSRELVINGESKITTTQSHKGIEKLVNDILTAFSFYGHVIFQIIEDLEGELYVIECNPRFGGASTLSLAAGLDSFYWFLNECSDLNIDSYPFLVSDKKQIRYSEDLIIYNS